MIESLKLDNDSAAISSSFQLLVNSLSAEVAKLEKNLVENKKLAGLITIQVRAIIAKERAKFEIPPEPVPGSLALQLKTRSVSVATSNVGAENNYEHPLKLDYNNPIEIIHTLKGSSCLMRFATRDGDIGKQPHSIYSLSCIVTQQAGSVIGKIHVYHSGCL